MNFENRYYESESEYLHAIAAAFREEILAITQAGLLVQLDCPYLPLARNVAKPNQWTTDGQPLYRTEEEYLRFVELSIEAQNYALQGIPREQIWCHICNGNQLSPHHFDGHLKDTLPFLPLMHCGFIYVEGANPQHQLDYQDLAKAKLPEGLMLIIGTIDTKTSTVETKELVAERLVRVASVVNPQKLIAGTDCGFATFGYDCKFDETLKVSDYKPSSDLLKRVKVLTKEQLMSSIQELSEEQIDALLARRDYYIGKIEQESRSASILGK